MARTTFNTDKPMVDRLVDVVIHQMRVERNTPGRRPHDEPPILILDLDEVETRYRKFHTAVPGNSFLAIKSNPAPPLLRRLVQLGAHLDAASIYEIDAALMAGADPAAISFGHVNKTTDAIQYALSVGVDMFAVQTHEGLAKMEAACRSVFPTPRADKSFARRPHRPLVYFRLAPNANGAGLALDGMFGQGDDRAVSILKEAHRMGYRVGLSGHVGTQNLNPAAYADLIKRMHEVSERLAAEGVPVSLLNLGGGFPQDLDLTPGKPAVPPIEEYGKTIRAALGVFGLRYPTDIDIPVGHNVSPDSYKLREKNINLWNDVTGRLGDPNDPAFDGETVSGVRGRWDRMPNGRRNKYAMTHPADLVVMTEAGRHMSGDAGYILVRVIEDYVSHNGERIIITNLGRYHGAVETAEATTIHHPVLLPKQYATSASSAGYLAGPTCDSTDRWAHPTPLPQLAEGDYLLFKGMGAYTNAFSGAQFNGFPSMRTLCISSTGEPEQPARARRIEVVEALHHVSEAFQLDFSGVNFARPELELL